MHKFTKVASGEREKQISSHSPLFDRMISYEVMESNLPTEDKRMHKFIEVGSGERETQISCHSPHFLSE